MIIAMSHWPQQFIVFVKLLHIPIMSNAVSNIVGAH
jgi:hypothetical protein